MTKTLWVNSLVLSLLLMTMMRAGDLCASGQTDTVRNQPTADSTQAATDVTGTWSGTFYSAHANVAPFTMTVVISRDPHGHLVGSTSLNSDCLNSAKLEVTVTGSKVVLAGSDEDGDSITVRGTVDSTGTLLKATYILNGSATGRCETGDGNGNLARR